MVNHKRKGNVFIIKIMSSGCTIKEMIEQSALAYEGCSVQVCWIYRCITTLYCFLTPLLRQVPYTALLPGFQQNSFFYMASFKWAFKYYTQFKSLWFSTVIKYTNIFSLQSQLLISDFSAPNLSLSLLPESSLWSTVQIIKDRSPNVNRRRWSH